MICASCGKPCPPAMAWDHKRCVWYQLQGPTYFSKPNQSKADFDGPEGRADFCSPGCAFAYMAPSMRIAA